MNAGVEDVLARASRCQLGAGGERPDVTPMVFWSDGAALWMTAPAATVRAAGLHDDPRCVAYVPPVDEAGHGVVVHGAARVYGTQDPLGVVLHTPTISTAMAALAARNAGALLGYMQDAALLPRRWLPRNRVVLRLVVESATAVEPPAVPTGVAPALPTVVPADVRRALAGVRRLALVYADGARLQATPAVWSAGYVLRTPPALRPPPGARVAAAVDTDRSPRPTRAVGLTVHGRIAEGGRLEPERVTSWHGFDSETAAVPRPAPGGVVLPD